MLYDSEMNSVKMTLCQLAKKLVTLPFLFLVLQTMQSIRRSYWLHLTFTISRFSLFYLYYSEFFLFYTCSLDCIRWHVNWL